MPKARKQPRSHLNWRPHAWCLLALWVAALLAYSSSFRTGLVFDNVTIVRQDPRIRAVTSQNIDLILHQEYWYNAMTTGLYRPLTTFSYLVNYTVLGNGPRPAGYHVVNFMLHGLNISLVYLLGLALLEKREMAFALAALWGLHPLLTESVTNIVGRADMLAAFGVLGGLLCHLASATATGGRKLAYRCGLALAAAIGIFSKESAAVLPGVMLLYDLCWSKRPVWRERIAGYIAALVPFAVYFYLRADLHARSPLGLVPFGDNPLVAADFWTAKLTAVQVIGKYLWLFIWPARLSADYSYSAVPLTGSWIVALACIPAVALLILAYRSHRPVFFWVAFFFIALSPAANLVILTGAVMAERFLYLPSIGLAACIVIAMSYVKPQRVAFAAIGLICLAYAGRTFARNFDWTDELTLWEATAAASPGSFKAHSLLAANLAGVPQALDRAVAEADRSLAILKDVPPELDSPRPYVTAATCYRAKGEYRKALDALLRAETIDKATREHIRALNLARGKRVFPQGWIPVYGELGRVYALLNETGKAADAFTRGRMIRGDPEFSEELSRLWLAKADWERAAISLIEGLVIDPNANRLIANLLRLYRQNAPTSCAISGGNINMQCPLVHTHLCTASQNVAQSYRQNAQPEKAEATMRTALQSLGCPSAPSSAFSAPLR